MGEISNTNRFLSRYASSKWQPQCHFERTWEIPEGNQISQSSLLSSFRNDPLKHFLHRFNLTITTMSFRTDWKECEKSQIRIDFSVASLLRNDTLHKLSFRTDWKKCEKSRFLSRSASSKWLNNLLIQKLPIRIKWRNQSILLFSSPFL